MRTLADILEEITCCEISIATSGDLGGYQAKRISALRDEISIHPDAAAGRDLPPINGTIGRV